MLNRHNALELKQISLDQNKIIRNINNYNYNNKIITCNRSSSNLNRFNNKKTLCNNYSNLLVGKKQKNNILNNNKKVLIVVTIAINITVLKQIFLKNALIMIN